MKEMCGGVLVLTLMVCHRFDIRLGLTWLEVEKHKHVVLFQQLITNRNKDTNSNHLRRSPKMLITISQSPTLPSPSDPPLPEIPNTAHPS